MAAVFLLGRAKFYWRAQMAQDSGSFLKYRTEIPFFLLRAESVSLDENTPPSAVVTARDHSRSGHSLFSTGPPFFFPEPRAV